MSKSEDWKHWSGRLFVAAVLGLSTVVFSLSSAQATETRIVAAGSQFTVALPENRSTGYSWQPIYSKGFLKLKRRTYSMDTTRIGAGGMARFVFVALRPGMTAIEFRRERLWERRPVDVVTVGITIR